MTSNWQQPITCQSLHSFVALCNFYHCVCPWFEIELQPFRNLIQEFYQKPLPAKVWTPSNIALFAKLKTDITSSPCLARFDDIKLIFLKTNWSANGFGYILIQLDDSIASIEATIELIKSGMCLFNKTGSTARLRPIRCRSRQYHESERHLHSFVSKAAAGCWAIAQNRKYLWVTMFYWLCNYLSVKEVLDYRSDIHEVHCWAQELLRYHFSIIHHPIAMMQDIDALLR